MVGFPVITPVESLVERVWENVGDSYIADVQSLRKRSDVSAEVELIFCLLGGFGVTFELCASATKVVAAIDPFSARWTDESLFKALVNALSCAQFDPPRVDGTPRRYRFPIKKSELIVKARQWVLANTPIDEAIACISDEKARRDFLCECPGVGLKTASWILRNLGAASELAILDVHILRLLQAMGRIEEVTMPKDYEFVEKEFLNWCRELGAPPAAFDLFVWDFQRSALRERCKT